MLFVFGALVTHNFKRQDFMKLYEMGIQSFDRKTKVSAEWAMSELNRVTFDTLNHTSEGWAMPL